MWPFKRKAEPETRDYTTAFIDRILTQAGVKGESANVAATAAAVAAAGAYARAFAAATVEPDAARTGLTPPVMGEVGASLILYGESVWAIDRSADATMLTRASSWDIQGGPSPKTWQYALELPGPSASATRKAGASGVLHFRINCDPSQPHKGRPAIGMAGLTASTLAEAERQLSEELSSAVGRLIPAPIDQLASEVDDPLEKLQATLRELKGRSALVPSMAKDWGGGMGGNQTDWTSRRLGADPPSAIVSLRTEVHNAVLSSAGVPPMLFAANSQANASREALRQFLHLSVAPIARVIEYEATDKLMRGAVKLDFAALQASDVQGRARAFQSMVGGGMDVAKAAALSGLLVGDD